jgi:hypothetical protein
MTAGADWAERGDQFSERLLELLEDATRRGLPSELVYTAAFAAAMTYGSRRAPMARQAADLRKVADRLDFEDNGPRRGRPPAH